MQPHRENSDVQPHAQPRERELISLGQISHGEILHGEILPGEISLAEISLLAEDGGMTVLLTLLLIGRSCPR